MISAKLYYSEGCRLCDAVMSQLDELGAKYTAVEVIETKAKDAWKVIETGEEIPINIMKGVPALFDMGVMIVGYQIGAIIGKYKSILAKSNKK